MKKEVNKMKALELRPYDASTDRPRTGWDEMSINDALTGGKVLYVDQFGDVWTSNAQEYIGKIL